MISYADVDTLDAETREEISDLFDHADALHDLPDDLGAIEAWDDFIAECERVGFPHLIASARLSQYTIYSHGGMALEALEAFVELMRVLRSHGDLVDPRNVAVQLNAIGTAATTLADDPRIPLEKITRLIDLVEEQMHARGVDVTGAHVARATVAAAAGDAEATTQWIDRWRAEAGDGWRADDAGVIQMEIPLIARFDSDRAAETLEQRLRVLGIDPVRIDSGAPNADRAAKLAALLAFLRVRQGRREEATAIADALVAALGIEVLAREVVPHYLILALEERPDLALVAVDRLLGESALDASDWEAVAAAARSRLLAQPHGTEGELLRALAQEGARAHDERAGTDVHSRELAELWWAGLPPASPPAITHVPDVWGEPEERAEHILSAGWLGRVGAVCADDPPIAIKYRYQALLGETMQLMSAETAEESDALATRLTARARELRCATSRYAVPLLHGLGAGRRGDVPTMVVGYGRALEELRALPANADHVVPDIRAMGERLFPTVVEQAVASPDVPWDHIHPLVTTEQEVRAATGAPRAPVILAHAEIAAHVDDVDRLQAIAADLQDAVADEQQRIDGGAIYLELVRLVARFSPGFADHLASIVVQAGDAEQIRAATVWRSWLRPADPAVAAELTAVLQEADDDVTELGIVPGWVVLEVLVRAGRKPVAVLDALLEEVDGGNAADLGLIAAGGSLLLGRDADDARGAELRERALAIATGLAQRDGTDVWRTWVGRRWYAGDPAFERA
ncbi:hypothetical protein [Litorihabitans aurantiacus]|uniref:Uncharacterized protein n=1 Tax=Litorihabitans aurantiacus TaxID=1930061 RepID=A0AA37XHE5_9MICO|nr:hypothetical protein [Litorihabitans aurantiacus]GMA33273.1 hypothetical protein GCM10025875_32650 [Litorihabitans aurantiacus]